MLDVLGRRTKADKEALATELEQRAAELERRAKASRTGGVPIWDYVPDPDGAEKEAAGLRRAARLARRPWT